MCQQCCRSGMFIPDPGSKRFRILIKEFKYFFTPKNCCYALGNVIRDVHHHPDPGPDPDLDFLPIPDPGLKKTPDPGFKSARLGNRYITRTGEFTSRAEVLSNA
jgi:hypothetical protein